MELTGEYTIAAPRRIVWEKLNDPDVLGACIPGCSKMERVDGNTMRAVLVARVGPLKATFIGELRLEDVDAPDRYRIVGEGKGGIAGFARGAADVTLVELDAETTRLAFAADAHAGGRLAQMGGKLIASSARKLSDRFFGRFAEEVCGDEDGAEGTVEVD